MWWRRGDTTVWRRVGDWKLGRGLSRHGDRSRIGRSLVAGLSDRHVGESEVDRYVRLGLESKYLTTMTSWVDVMKYLCVNGSSFDDVSKDRCRRRGQAGFLL